MDKDKFVIFSVIVAVMVFFNVGTNYLNQSALDAWFPIFFGGSIYFILKLIEKLIIQKMDYRNNGDPQLTLLIHKIRNIEAYLKSMNDRDMNREGREKIKAEFYDEI
jgi:hypothetical protein